MRGHTRQRHQRNRTAQCRFVGGTMQGNPPSVHHLRPSGGANFSDYGSINAVELIRHRTISERDGNLEPHQWQETPPTREGDADRGVFYTRQPTPSRL